MQIVESGLLVLVILFIPVCSIIISSRIIIKKVSELSKNNDKYCIAYKGRVHETVTLFFFFFLLNVYTVMIFYFFIMPNYICFHKF